MNFLLFSFYFDHIEPIKNFGNVSNFSVKHDEIYGLFGRQKEVVTKK